jgi:tetratricopeptide (TPR) repeat protein
MCSLTLLVASLLPTVASAQTEQLDEAARLTFESAREAFVAGDYEVALARFRQAYQLSPRPGLLYNIAQTLDRLRRDEETVEALREYLRVAPEAQNRSEVEARIRVLERALAERRQAEPPPSTGTTTPPPSQGIGILHPGIFFGAAGATLVSAGLLIWSGLETLALNDAYLATRDFNAAAAALARAEDQQLLTNVFIGITAGLGVASVVLAILSDWNALTGGSGQSAAVRPLFQAGPNGAWLGLGASF